MNYRYYGATGKLISEMSIGSTRFNPSDLEDEAGLFRCAELVAEANSLGMNYFDIAHNYAKSQCEHIYRHAFKMMKNPYFVTSKSSSFQDNTADDVLRRIENSLKTMDVNQIDFFYLWSIMDQAHYKDIMKPGGAYEGALLAQNRGLIKHITFSNHATPHEAIDIINDGYFEGVTLSYNLLNHSTMDAVIESAYKQQMGITVMNPLAGGIIPENHELFSGVFDDPDYTLAQSALKYVIRHPHVTSVLSGVSNTNELHENLKPFNISTDSNDLDVSWRNKVVKEFSEIGGLCTGCGYCRTSCPKLIPIPEMMQSYNMSLLKTSDRMYGRTDKKLLTHISMMKKLILDLKIQPENSDNPCIRCGQCEKICTQHLPIITQLDQMYQVIEDTSASRQHYKERLETLLIKPNYKKIAFYTAGGYTAKVLQLLGEFFDIHQFEIVVFDSNSSRWGDQLNGYPVENPELISIIQPECIVISNYNFDSEIYESLQSYQSMGIDIIKLHFDNDAPWVF